MKLIMGLVPLESSVKDDPRDAQKYSVVRQGDAGAGPSRPGLTDRVVPAGSRVLQMLRVDDHWVRVQRFRHLHQIIVSVSTILQSHSAFVFRLIALSPAGRS